MEYNFRWILFVYRIDFKRIWVLFPEEQKFFF